MKQLKFYTTTLYIILSILISIFILSKLFIICFIAQHILKHFEFQLIIYVIISIFLILMILTSIFLKNLYFRIKIIIVIFCFLLFIVFGNMPATKKINNIQQCYKTGICAQGLDATTKDNTTFKINKENCQKYNYKWNNFKHTCDLRSEYNLTKQNKHVK